MCCSHNLLNFAPYMKETSLFWVIQTCHAVLLFGVEAGVIRDGTYHFQVGLSGRQREHPPILGVPIWAHTHMNILHLPKLPFSHAPHGFLRKVVTPLLT